MPNSFQCVRDRGNTFISHNGIFVDRVKSNNNWFTRFFAEKIFGTAIPVDFFGKRLSFNWKDYGRMLNAHGEAIQISKAIVKSHADFCLQQIRPPNPDAGPLSRYLSYSKRESLFYKLVRAMHNHGNPNLAEKYVAKGADLNLRFWTRGTAGISYGSMKAHLPHHKLTLEMQNYTPLIFAKERDWDTLADFMIHCGAYTAAEGEHVSFRREILGNNAHTSLEPSVTFVRRRGTTYPHYRARPHLDVNTTYTATIQDTETRAYSLVFNPATNSVIKRHFAQPQVHTHTFEAVIGSHTIPAF